MSILIWDAAVGLVHRSPSPCDKSAVFHARGFVYAAGDRGLKYHCAHCHAIAYHFYPTIALHVPDSTSVTLLQQARRHSRLHAAGRLGWSSKLPHQLTRRRRLLDVVLTTRGAHARNHLDCSVAGRSAMRAGAGSGRDACAGSLYCSSTTPSPACHTATPLLGCAIISCRPSAMIGLAATTPRLPQYPGQHRTTQIGLPSGWDARAQRLSGTPHCSGMYIYDTDDARLRCVRHSPANRFGYGRRRSRAIQAAAAMRAAWSAAPVCAAAVVVQFRHVRLRRAMPPLAGTTRRRGGLPGHHVGADGGRERGAPYAIMREMQTGTWTTAPESARFTTTTP